MISIEFESTDAK